MIKLKQIEFLLLFHVFVRTRTTKDVFHPTRSELRELMKNYAIGGGDVDSAASELRRDDRLSYSAGANGYYKISASGIRAIEDALQDERSELLQALRRYNSEHEKILATIQFFPASDRIVALNHNSAPYIEAIAKLDETTAAVRSANDIGAASQEEREAVVSELTSLRKLLENTRVRGQAILALAGPAFNWIAKTFTQEGLKRLASEALDAIKALL